MFKYTIKEIDKEAALDMIVRYHYSNTLPKIIKHYKGMQLKYIYFLCNKRLKKKLLKEATVDLNFNYPKTKDLK
ncbi:hypothetical protein ACSXA3_08040 [Clostridium perfringens]